LRIVFLIGFVVNVCCVPTERH